MITENTEVGYYVQMDDRLAAPPDQRAIYT